MAALATSVATALANMRPPSPPPAAAVPLPAPLALPNFTPGIAPHSAFQAGSGLPTGPYGTMPYPSTNNPQYLFNPYLPSQTAPLFGGPGDYGSYGAFRGLEGYRGYGSLVNYGTPGSYPMLPQDRAPFPPLSGVSLPAHEALPSISSRRVHLPATLAAAAPPQGEGPSTSPRRVHFPATPAAAVPRDVTTSWPYSLPLSNPHQGRGGMQG